MTLAGRTALITGANRGLGHAIATKLVQEGASVALTAREESLLAEVAAKLQNQRPSSEQRVVWRAVDVADKAQVEALTEYANHELGQLDVLVCNAGVYGPIGPAEDNDWDAWRQAVEINLFGVVLCCRAVVPIMRRRGYGKIIGLSGGGATKALPRFSAYAASKAGVVRFLETLAEELAGTGIDVNAIAPGALNTRLLDQVLEAGPEASGEAFFKSAQSQADKGGTPLEVGADLVAWLASSDSDGISGRLIAAVWDDWKNFPAIREQLMGSDVYTLRRIVPEDRGWA